ncbi:MAG: aminotransferase class I/II-fold pyridoxal phosphate-dependent enzyme, partial [Acidobacteria bacterium]|nr:aminotransferase class I/II-fold pyridoxal phosphate-dependent enzyme [Acidobacteriota bacterium]
AIQAIQKSFSQSGRYASNTPELRRALCNHHQVSSGMLDLGYGSSELLKMAAEAFLGPGKNVVTAQPTYEAPARYGAVYGASPIRVPLDAQYRHDLKKMRAAVNDKTGMVYICNPNNPTATVVSAEAVKTFVDSMPTDIPIVIDEAYHHYVDDPAYASAIPLAKQGKTVVVVRTFSKIYGMAGLRLGYAVGREDLISKMSTYKIWLNTNTLTVAAALASLDDREFVERNRKLNAGSRQYVEQQVTQMGLRYIPSQANFLMVDLKRDMGSVVSALRDRNVYAGRPFYPLSQHLRVTIGTREEMKRFVEALRAVVA